MSVEAHSPFERISNPEERIRGVEYAAETIVRLRLLIEEHAERLRLEDKEAAADPVMIKYLKDTIAELGVEVESMLAFLEEFDPILFQRMKNNN